MDVSAVEMAQNLALIAESEYFDDAYYQTQRADLVRVADLKRQRTAKTAAHPGCRIGRRPRLQYCVV